MAKDYRKFLAGQMGESLVVAELGRLGIVATSFSGNLPDADIVAFYEGRNIHVQVKAMRTVSAHSNARTFLDIEFDGPKQIIKGRKALPESGLIYVYVKLGDAAGQDRFFILTYGDMQDVIYEGYRSYLARKDYIRPKNPASTHCSIGESDLLKFENNWDLIKGRLGIPIASS